jgi:hypothetical protein
MPTAAQLPTDPHDTELRLTSGLALALAGTAACTPVPQFTLPDAHAAGEYRTTTSSAPHPTATTRRLRSQTAANDREPRDLASAPQPLLACRRKTISGSQS